MNIGTRVSSVFMLIFLLSACDSPEGVNYERDLYRGDDGLVYLKSSEVIFTGHVYLAVCEECNESLLGSWPFHYVGHYKDGRMHGEFWFPKSGRSDDFFEYSDRANQRKVVYLNGEVVERYP